MRKCNFRGYGSVFSVVERFIVYLCIWSSGFEVFILNFVILKCWVGVSLLSPKIRKFKLDGVV